jgi:hypothetical protein
MSGKRFSGLLIGDLVLTFQSEKLVRNVIFCETKFHLWAWSVENDPVPIVSGSCVDGWIRRQTVSTSGNTPRSYSGYDGLIQERAIHGAATVTVARSFVFCCIVDRYMTICAIGPDHPSHSNIALFGADDGDVDLMKGKRKSAARRYTTPSAEGTSDSDKQFGVVWRESQNAYMSG